MYTLKLNENTHYFLDWVSSLLLEIEKSNKLLLKLDFKTLKVDTPKQFIHYFSTRMATLEISIRNLDITVNDIFEEYDTVLYNLVYLGYLKLTNGFNEDSFECLTINEVCEKFLDDYIKKITTLV